MQINLESTKRYTKNFMKHPLDCKKLMKTRGSRIEKRWRVIQVDE